MPTGPGMGSSVTPTLAPGAIVLCVTAAPTRSQSTGRTERPSPAPSGTPTSIAMPNMWRRGPGLAALRSASGSGGVVGSDGAGTKSASDGVGATTDAFGAGDISTGATVVV